MDLRSSVEQYVKAAEARAQAKRTLLNGYVEVGFGRDSNIGSATGSALLTLPGAGAYVPTPPMGQQTADNYATVGLGGEVNHQLTDQWSLYAGGDLRGRAYQTYTDPSTGSLDVRGGASYSGGAWLIRGGLTAGQYWMKNDRLRDSLGVTADWRMAHESGSQVSAGVSVVKAMYVPIQAKQDATTTTLNLGWLTSLGDGTTVLSITGSVGNENAVGGRDDGDRRFWGPRIFVQKTFNDVLGGYISAGATFSDYAAVNPLYLFSRSETLYDLALGLTWAVAKGVSVRPQLSYIKNNSNAELYSYDKTDLSVNVRFDF